MSEKKPFKFPLGLVMLDVLGTALVGLGLAKMLAGVNVLPGLLQLDESGWMLIIAGGLMMLPLMLFLLSEIRERIEQHIVK